MSPQELVAIVRLGGLKGLLSDMPNNVSLFEEGSWPYKVEQRLRKVYPLPDGYHWFVIWASQQSAYRVDLRCESRPGDGAPAIGHCYVTIKGVVE